MKILWTLVVFFVVDFASLSAAGRFPKPEFDTNYDFPPIPVPNDNSEMSFNLMVAFVLAAMALVACFTLWKRSRLGVATVMIVSLLYLGFYRSGCLCAVGSLQNVALAVAQGSVLPWAVVVLFLAPLVFALFFGRVFCGGVCPLGAIQDAVVVKPVKVPTWLEHCLGMIPYLYLGLAVLYAATGSAFIICENDPFVGLFRVNGPVPMIAAGVFMLLLGMFVGRPYCRYLCPYGVLLRWTSFFAKFRLSITPGECVKCRLCEDACPFGAIRRPTSPPSESREVGRKRLMMLFLTLPIVVTLFGWGTSRLVVLLARKNATVRLAQQVQTETLEPGTGTTLYSQTFHAAERSKRDLYAEASAIQDRFKLGAWLLGAFLGLVVMVKLISLSIRRERSEYELDPMKCLCCGRCFQFCPMERSLGSGPG